MTWRRLRRPFWGSTADTAGYESQSRASLPPEGAPTQLRGGEVGQDPVAGPILEPAPSQVTRCFCHFSCSSLRWGFFFFFFFLLLNIGIFISGKKERHDWILLFSSDGFLQWAVSQFEPLLKTQAVFFPLLNRTFFLVFLFRSTFWCIKYQPKCVQVQFYMQRPFGVSLLLSKCLQRLKHL